jgi:hypothetical protein
MSSFKRRSLILDSPTGLGSYATPFVVPAVLSSESDILYNHQPC